MHQKIIIIIKLKRNKKTVKRDLLLNYNGRRLERIDYLSESLSACEKFYNLFVQPDRQIDDRVTYQVEKREQVRKTETETGRNMP